MASGKPKRKLPPATGCGFQINFSQNTGGLFFRYTLFGIGIWLFGIGMWSMGIGMRLMGAMVRFTGIVVRSVGIVVWLADIGGELGMFAIWKVLTGWYWTG